jgi:hypothetical protein
MKETGTSRRELVRPTMMMIKILVRCATAPTSKIKTQRKDSLGKNWD